MGYYTHQDRKFYFVRSRKSGVITRAYLDNPLQAEADAEAIDEEFELKGCPKEEWCPSKTPCAQKQQDPDLREEWRLEKVPMLMSVDGDEVGFFYIAVDENDTEYEPMGEREEAVAFTQATRPRW